MILLVMSSKIKTLQLISICTTFNLAFPRDNELSDSDMKISLTTSF